MYVRNSIASEGVGNVLGEEVGAADAGCAGYIGDNVEFEEGEERGICERYRSGLVSSGRERC